MCKSVSCYDTGFCGLPLIALFSWWDLLSPHPHSVEVLRTLRGRHQRRYRSRTRQAPALNEPSRPTIRETMSFSPCRLGATSYVRAQGMQSMTVSGLVLQVSQIVVQTSS